MSQVPIRQKIVAGLGIALILMPCIGFFYPLFFGYTTVAELESVTVFYAGISANSYDGTRYWIETVGSDQDFIIEDTVSHLFDYSAFTAAVNPGAAIELRVDGISVLGIHVDGAVYLDENDSVQARNANARGFVIFGTVYLLALAAVFGFAVRKKKRSISPENIDTQGETT